MKTRALLLMLSSLVSPLALATGTVDVYTAGDSKPKTLTNAEHLVDLVGQPRLANSWWPGAVVSERRATITEQARHQALLARLTTLASEEGGDSAAAINGLRQQLQGIKVTGRQLVELDPDFCARIAALTGRWKATTPCGWEPSRPPLPWLGW